MLPMRAPAAGRCRMARRCRNKRRQREPQGAGPCLRTQGRDHGSEHDSTVQALIRDRRTPFEIRLYCAAQPDLTMNGKRPLTKAESAHMGRISAMRCVCCYLLSAQQETASQVHHIRADREERNHRLTIPLCEACHAGRNGIHGDKALLRILKISEWALLAIVIGWLLETRKAI